MSSRNGKIALALLIAVAGAQYAWNVRSLNPTYGYDFPGHQEYMRTIVLERRLPHPLAGWSTSHPPLYYIVGSALWVGLSPLGQGAVDRGLMAISALSTLAAGLLTFGLVRRLGSGPLVAWTSAALVLFVPCSQLAAVMISNEALGVSLAAAALPPIFALQADPRRKDAAALAGLFVGLALATKYTGMFVASACVVPFLRRDFDRRMAASLGVGALLVGLIAGPVYLRNLALTGSLFPLTVGREPLRSVDAMFILGPRRVVDYLWIPPASLWSPSIGVLRPDQTGKVEELSPVMRNVWGLFYASAWADPFYTRIPPWQYPRGGFLAMRALTFAGIVPTLLSGVGLALGLLQSVRSRGRSADAPLVVMACVGLAAFTGFTWSSPSMVSVKAAYLLPLAAPAGVFFSRGVSWLRPAFQRPALLLSAVAASLAALVFTQGLLFAGYG